ncbi:MAG: zinc-ribbon domain-containing protein, partial [Gammaproteobacteria bacterium]|nr:zinc-ribbon domain-containing protein [Gammaproteobacteria bacterium]
MQTECPHCHTVFRVSEEQLERADAQLRCGHCLAIFTAESPYQNPSRPELSSNNTVDDNEELLTNDHQPLPDVIPPELRAETRSNRHHYSITGTL